ncbi:regulatory sensor-transducer, BlaR1/MecR1 family protein [Flavobacterium azooxidireducens]|uniref:Regulatory sensor-transducer, BlaR1/MecR1 family protein n=1 Tax=Flavobacterium azooxidireducens TaxID=1871076 RepID=A0ABY4KEE1_9FLAO|nr:M56 family metallopeptidase [Flavobacterium azooxidireducens]UPQ77755.1 regulatory sensor-transducer, BlaR1/MecR1 family protein [Flavobacterium azooxidireducens]
MIDFIIKSSFSLSVFFIFYKLFLENEKIHLFNRFYLLITLVFSLVIPFITIQTANEIPLQNFQTFIAEPIVIKQKESSFFLFNWTVLFFVCYGLVTLTLLIRFAKNVLNLLKKAKANPFIYFKNTKVILVEEETIPHTFLNFIFVNKQDFQNNQIQEELFSHELVHIHQKHSVDILFIEILKTILWFNPLFYAYKKAIQLNHEFLADENIVKKYNNVPFYQALLLNTNGNKPIYLASNLNYLVTKKRLIMMTKSTSKRMNFIKKTASLAIMASLFLFLSLKVNAQEKVKSNSTKSIKSTAQSSSYYDNTIVVFKDKKGNQREVKYADLDEEQKKRIPPPPPEARRMKVSEIQFDKFKNKTNYAVWIDGVVIENEKLNSLSSNDFVFLTESFVHKNARSNRFPQEKQVHLYTEKGFVKGFLNKKDYAPNQTIYLQESSK